MKRPGLRAPVLLGVATTTLLVLSGCTGSNGPNATVDATTPSAPIEQSPVFEGTHSDYHTRPDLQAFTADVTAGPAAEQASEGLVLLAPRDPGADQQPVLNAILDDEGQPLWLQNFDELDEANSYANNFVVETYKGEPMLMWWEGTDRGGRGYGEIVLADTSYQEAYRIAAAGGYAPDGPDFHEFRITDRDTLLWVAYTPTRTDLSDIGGAQDGWVSNGVVQEVDIATGEILFEWSALNHVPVSHTKADLVEEQEADASIGTEESPFDYFHINSVQSNDGSLLVSARNTHAVYNVDIGSGDLNWTLGGARSDFEMSEEAYFSWQHDAQLEEDGTIRIFDNASTPAYRENSRVVWLELDEDAGTASISRQIDPPEPRRADYMGNASRLDNGNLLVGWGREPFYTEYADDGSVVFDADMGPFTSYRAQAAPWVGTPVEPPALAVEDAGVYVSWNGATEVAQWRLLTGEDEARASEERTVEKTGFETLIPVSPGAAFVAVEALDVSGNVIGVSSAPRN